jgi:hypothetical protein
MTVLKKLATTCLLLAMALTLTSCEPNVYASVGYSSWGGGYNSGGLGGSISVGGRICC